MKKYIYTAVGIAMSLSLAACFGDDDDDDDPVVVDPPTPTTLTISGDAIKGTLANAMVEVFAASDMTTAVGSAAQTDATGSFSVTITDASGNPITGAFYVVVTADDDTTMICDAVTCGSVARAGTVDAADLDGLVLSSMVYADGTATTLDVNVNGFTTLASDAIIAAAAENDNISLGSVTMSDFTSLQLSASQLIGGMIGIELPANTNLFTVEIVDASVAANIPTDDTAANLTLLNAAFAGLSDTAEANGKLARVNLGVNWSSWVNAISNVISAVLINPQVDLEAQNASDLAVLRSANLSYKSAYDSVVLLVESEGREFTVFPLGEVAVTKIISAIGNSGIGSGGSGG